MKMESLQVKLSAEISLTETVFCIGRHMYGWSGRKKTDMIFCCRKEAWRKSHSRDYMILPQLDIYRREKSRFRLH